MVTLGKFNQGRNQQRLVLHESEHEKSPKIGVESKALKYLPSQKLWKSGSP
jgi:hypothetical protein